MVKVGLRLGWVIGGDTIQSISNKKSLFQERQLKRNSPRRRNSNRRPLIWFSQWLFYQIHRVRLEFFHLVQAIFFNYFFNAYDIGAFDRDFMEFFKPYSPNMKSTACSFPDSEVDRCQSSLKSIQTLLKYSLRYIQKTNLFVSVGPQPEH